jgi:hypothetical protein
MCTGIIRAFAPKTPRRAASRSSVKAPIGRAGIHNFEGVQGEARVATTSVVVMGSETGPACKNGVTAGQQLLGST